MPASHAIETVIETSPSSSTITFPGNLTVTGTFAPASSAIAGAATVGTTLGVTGLTSATGGLVVGTGEGIATGIKNLVLFSGASVAVPSITDPDIASVNVDVSSLALGIALGDHVVSVGFGSALPTNCRYLGAYVSATDQVTLVFGSEGGNVTGANRAVTILIADVT